MAVRTPAMVMAPAMRHEKSSNEPLVMMLSEKYESQSAMVTMAEVLSSCERWVRSRSESTAAPEAAVWRKMNSMGKVVRGAQRSMR